MATIAPARKDTEHGQAIRFCRGHDGVRLAYAVHGSGPPLIIVSCWLSHLQHDWQSPVWRHFLDDLGRLATVARYDERGFGLSDWSISDFSLEARITDLEAVVSALGFEQFALLGMSGGAPVAISYAARHPERVTRFAIYGGIARGCFGGVDDVEAEEAFRALIRAGWARPESLFRRVFTSVFIPDATEQQMQWLDDLQRMSTSTENAVASRIARQEIDVRWMLPAISHPSLVLHARGDQAVSFEAGCEIAALMPNSRLVALESRNHILLADEPAWPVFRAEIRQFLEPERSRLRSDVDARTTAELSSREREIVRLAAEGRSNAEIAEALVLSVRTVERHLSNVYLKLGISGKAARTAAVASLLRQQVV